MDIAALSMGMSQMNLQQQASMSVLKLAMDSVNGQVGGMLEILEEGMVNTDARIMEHSVTPHLGGSIDVRL